MSYIFDKLKFTLGTPFLTHYRPAMPFGNRKFILQDFSSSVSLRFKKYYPSGNLKLSYLGIFQTLKLRISMKKILTISLKLSFTTDTLGCYGLIGFFDSLIE